MVAKIKTFHQVDTQKHLTPTNPLLSKIPIRVVPPLLLLVNINYTHMDGVESVDGHSTFEFVKVKLYLI